MTIQPKKTTYRSIEFASKLEARWAVFLDFNPVVTAWQYEAIRISQNGIRVKPDFLIRIHTDPVILEIKPAEISNEYRTNFLRSIAGIESEVLIAIGDFYAGNTPYFLSNEDDFKERIEFDSHILGASASNGSIEIARTYRFDLSNQPVSPRIVKSGEFKRELMRWGNPK